MLSASVIKEYLKKQDVAIFDYLADSKHFRDSKWILDQFLAELLKLNFDQTIKRLVLPYFCDQTSQSRLLQVLTESDEKCLWSYMSEMIKFEKLHGKILVHETNRYKYLELIKKFEPNQLIPFLRQDVLLDLNKCFDLLQDEPLATSYLWEKRGNLDQAIQIVMDSFVVAIQNNDENLVENLKKRMQYFCLEYLHLNTWMDYYLKLIEILISCKMECEGRKRQDTMEQIDKWNQEIKECRDEIMLLDQNDPRCDAKRKIIKLRQDQIKSLKNPVNINKDVNMRLQKSIQHELNSIEARNVLEAIVVLQIIVKQHSDCLEYVSESMHHLIKIHQEEVEWLKLANNVLKREMINFQKNIFEKRAKMGTRK